MEVQGGAVPMEPVDATQGLVLDKTGHLAELSTNEAARGTKLETFGFSKVKLAMAGPRI